MPTTLYTKGGPFSFAGIEYIPEGGKIDVPDQAVDTLVESHGFSTEPFPAEKVEKPTPDSKEFDINKLNKAELVKLNKEEELGAALANTMTVEKIQELVIPLWEAKQAAKNAPDTDKTTAQ